MRPRSLNKILCAALGIALICFPAAATTAGAAALEGGSAASGGGGDAEPAVAELGQPAASDQADGAGQAGDGDQADGAARPMAAIPVIDRSDKTAVATAFLDYYVPAKAVAMGWTGSVTSCAAGAPSAAAQTATFDAVNYFRRMAGLGLISENTAASRVAQKTALMMHANGGLSHYPPTTWKCFSNNGAFLAAKSNIAWGSGGDGILAGAKAVSAYVNDVDVASLGHRRWLLSPAQVTMGSGSTSNANALVWGSGSGSCTAAECTVSGWNSVEDATFTNSYGIAWSSPQLVAWPPAGYFPHQLTRSDFSTSQMDWSVATGSSSISFTSANVSVTKNGAAISGIVKTPAATLGAGYGDRGAFAFSLPAGVVSLPGAGQVDTYNVTITGITGYASGTFQYEVKVFDPTNSGLIAQSVAKPVISGTAQVGQAMTVAAVATTPAGGTVQYQWVVDGAVVKSGTDAAARTFTPLATHAGKTVSVKVTATRSGYQTATNQSDSRVIVAAADNCGMAQATLTPRLTSTGGAPTTSASELTRSQVLRVCKNGELRLYSFSAATGELELTSVIGSGWSTYRLSAPGDWNRDGFNDVIGIDSAGRLFLYPRTSANGWGTRKQIGHGWQMFTDVMAVGDLTRDGNPDLLAIDRQGTLYLYQGDGNTGWKNSGRGTRVGGGWTGFQLLAAGDLNGDKINDIMSIDQAGRLYWYRSLGSGQFARPIRCGGGWHGFTAISGASLDGDAVADLLSVDTVGTVRYYSGTGLGGFNSPRTAATGWK
ncbi:MAG: FG-GAP-like repeat-containing protein [Bifidobacteriaceae bacterium]|jgi:uncharacterized protein YkwD|nr:FG-GAP-like repeat-containing protein [Bifidobacteriaceae bacterium]